MNVEQRAVTFTCEGDHLYGVLTLPLQERRSRGVLVVVGGPQYRVGSHRQFALLARELAAQGVATMRFDYRGMGDSEGEARSFESVGADLRAAIDRFFREVPEISEVVLWGLCDGASASLFYAHDDPRVTGLVLLNPWVRTEGGEAKAILKHYYLRRLTSMDMWKKILSGRFSYVAALGSLLQKVGTAMGNRQTGSDAASSPGASGAPAIAAATTLPQRMLDGFARFEGNVLLVISGNDLTAKEFTDLAGASPKWRKLLAAPRVRRHTLVEANHTFSQDTWRRQVNGWTADWVTSW